MGNPRPAPDPPTVREGQITECADHLVQIDVERLRVQAERNAYMREMRADGWTLQALADLSGMTHQGVSKIIHARARILYAELQALEAAEQQTRDWPW